MSMALDASVIIAHLDPSDAHHAPATTLLLDAAGAALLAHPLTIVEALVFAVRSGSGAEVRDAIRSMGVVVADMDAEGPLRLARLRVETGLRMPDCCVLDVAQEGAASVATFDDRLARAAAALGLVVVSR